MSAGNKRKDWGPSSDLSPGASSSGASADPRQVLAAAGPVGADLVPGQYDQISSNTTKNSYKNRIFRVDKRRGQEESHTLRENHNEKEKKRKRKAGAFS